MAIKSKRWFRTRQWRATEWLKHSATVPSDSKIEGEEIKKHQERTESKGGLELAIVQQTNDRKEGRTCWKIHRE